MSRLLDLARAADCSGRIHQAVLLVGAAMRRWARLALASEVTGPAETRRPAAAVPCRFPWRAAARRHCRGRAWRRRPRRSGRLRCRTNSSDRRVPGTGAVFPAFCACTLAANPAPPAARPGCLTPFYLTILQTYLPGRVDGQGAGAAAANVAFPGSAVSRRAMSTRLRSRRPPGGRALPPRSPGRRSAASSATGTRRARADSPGWR